jgi:hypothetical protein
MTKVQVSLDERVANLEARLELLNGEVRTRRLVVVDDHGHEWLHTAHTPDRFTLVLAAPDNGRGNPAHQVGLEVDNAPARPDETSGGAVWITRGDECAVQIDGDGVFADIVPPAAALAVAGPAGGCNGACDLLGGLCDDEEWRLQEHNEFIEKLASGELRLIADALEVIGINADPKLERTPGIPHPVDFAQFVHEHNWPDPVAMRGLSIAVTTLWRAR